ncbi:MAG: 50S ribosomal protein L10 [Bacteroidetes bacterium]|nr:50S ribosomal protein L10 [Bacteroidota bacterium]
MTREEKNQVIDNLKADLEKGSNFYLTDISAMTVEDTNNLRRLFHAEGVRITVVKNALLKKAMEKTEGRNFSELIGTLKGSTSILYTESGSMPAKVIQAYRKKNKSQKPLVKAAFIEECAYIGDQLDVLASIKSKNDLIADVIALLQSPSKNLIGALQSGGGKIAGIVKTLSERPE